MKMSKTTKKLNDRLLLVLEKLTVQAKEELEDENTSEELILYQQPPSIINDNYNSIFAENETYNFISIITSPEVYGFNRILIKFL